MIEIQDNSETIEVEVFKIPQKEVEVKIEEKEPELIKEIDPIDTIINEITVNMSEYKED